MTEWAVFGVIVALISFIAAIAAPMLKLNTTIVKLTVKLEHLEEVFTKTAQDASDSNKRIWVKLDNHGDKLDEHERRIQHIEDKEELVNK